ncbi:hypothetical protein ACHAPE_006615 [Trichoderma viride]
MPQAPITGPPSHGLGGFDPSELGDILSILSLSSDCVSTVGDRSTEITEPDA